MRTLATCLLCLIASVANAGTLEVFLDYPVESDVRWKNFADTSWMEAVEDINDLTRFSIDYDEPVFQFWVTADGPFYYVHDLSWVTTPVVEVHVQPPSLGKYARIAYVSGEDIQIEAPELQLIPEPSTLALGLVGLALVVRRYKCGI